MGMLIWILYDIIYKISQKSAEGLIWELEFFLSWDWCIHGYSNRLIINWNPDVQQWLSAWWKYIYIFIYLYIYKYTTMIVGINYQLCSKSFWWWRSYKRCAEWKKTIAAWCPKAIPSGSQIWQWEIPIR